LNETATTTTQDTTINITETIITTINTLLEKLFSSIDNSLYSTLDNITFINSDILHDQNFEKIFGTNTTNGILLIANSLLLGFLLYFSVKYLLSHMTNLKIESPYQFIFKLLIFAIFMNFSYTIVEIFIDLISNISLAIRGLGESIFNKDPSFSELISTINNNLAIDTSSLDIFSMDGIIKTTLSVSLLTLIFSYSIRYIMLKVFLLLAPFAFLSLSLDNTSWFFKAWIKNVFALLFIQIIIALVLLILFSIDYSSGGLLNKFLYIGGIYTLIKANSFVRDFIGGVSTNFSQSVYNYYSYLN
jgi:hypothetical protein